MLSANSAKSGAAPSKTRNSRPPRWRTDTAVGIPATRTQDRNARRQVTRSDRGRFRGRCHLSVPGEPPLHVAVPGSQQSGPSGPPRSGILFCGPGFIVSAALRVRLTVNPSMLGCESGKTLEIREVRRLWPRFNMSLSGSAHRATSSFLLPAAGETWVRASSATGRPVRSRRFPQARVPSANVRNFEQPRAFRRLFPLSVGRSSGTEVSGIHDSGTRFAVVPQQRRLHCVVGALNGERSQ